MSEARLLVRAELDGRIVGAAELSSLDELLVTLGRYFELGEDYDGEYAILVAGANMEHPAVQVSRNQHLALYFIASTLERWFWPEPSRVELDEQVQDEDADPATRDRESAA